MTDTTPAQRLADHANSWLDGANSMDSTAPGAALYVADLRAVLADNERMAAEAAHHAAADSADAAAGSYAGRAERLNAELDMVRAHLAVASQQRDWAQIELAETRARAENAEDQRDRLRRQLLGYVGPNAVEVHPEFEAEPPAADDAQIGAEGVQEGQERPNGALGQSGKGEGAEVAQERRTGRCPSCGMHTFLDSDGNLIFHTPKQSPHNDTAQWCYGSAMRPQTEAGDRWAWARQSPTLICLNLQHDRCPGKRPSGEACTCTCHPQPTAGTDG